MKINSFEELTQFISDEYLKMSDTYNVTKPSDKFIEFVENTLIKYTKLYDKPLHKLQKKQVKNMYYIEMKELELEKAIATMPHGKIWQFFHKELWKKIKYRNKDFRKEEQMKKEEKPVSATTSLAVVVKPVSPPTIVEEEAT